MKISYDPFWRTIKNKGLNQYILINKMKQKIQRTFKSFKLNLYFHILFPVDIRHNKFRTIKYPEWNPMISQTATHNMGSGLFICKHASGSFVKQIKLRSNQTDTAKSYHTTVNMSTKNQISSPAIIGLIKIRGVSYQDIKILRTTLSDQVINITLRKFVFPGPAIGFFGQS